MIVVGSRLTVLSVTLLCILVSGCQGKSNKTKIGKRQTQVKNLGLTKVPTKGTKESPCLDLPALLQELRDKKTWLAQMHVEDMSLFAKESRFLTGEYQDIDYEPAKYTQLKEEGLDYEVSFTKDLDSNWIRFPSTQDGCQSVQIANQDVRENGDRNTSPLLPGTTQQYDTYRVSKAGRDFIVYENAEKSIRYTVKLEGANSLSVLTEAPQTIGDFCNREDQYFSRIRSVLSWGDSQVPTELTVTLQLIKRWEAVLTLPEKLKESLGRIKKDAARSSVLRVPIQTYLLVREYLSRPEGLNRPACPTQPSNPTPEPEAAQ
ncbi:MAG: hypothetical protein H6624_17990 [Bdellovibrionaceae bacterium]|nr:hypothetical protein [Bdellovibrionales bacterium]MCB9086237.1 hypothetical protein [Pseudobdellovibrionaceae bacterium]